MNIEIVKMYVWALIVAILFFVFFKLLEHFKW